MIQGPKILRILRGLARDNLDPRNIWPPGYNFCVTAGPFLKYLISRFGSEWLAVRRETTKETTKDLEEENVLNLTI